MSNQKTYESIEAYLNGKLTGSDLTEFEAQLQVDQDLADQVSLFREIDEAVNDKAVLSFQEVVQSESAAYEEKNTSEKNTVRKIGWSRRFLSIAAALIFLIISVVVFWNIQSKTFASGEELFAQNFETYTLNRNLRSEESTSNEVFSSGIQRYQAKDFKAAAQAFQQLISTDEQDMVLVFCLANAYLNQQPPELELAAKEFQKVIEEGESIYVSRAKWYRALIHLKKEELGLAKSLLIEVSQAGGNLGEQAATVLKSMK